MSELIPQKHGGALLARPPAGAANKGTSFRQLRKECRELMAGDNVRNVQKLQALCESDDDRVAVIALKEWFERLYGRAGETGFAADEGATMHDLSNISHDDRLRLSEAFTTIRDILGIGPGGLPGLVIEG